jgi:hypothetical protein
MGWARTIALALLALLAGCRGASEGLPELQGGAEMALRRGSAWNTIKVRPPYAIGPRVNLHFSKDGRVSGNIDSNVVTQGRIGDNRLGGVSLTIDQDGIEGTGPYGAVAVDVEETPDTLTFEGSWNGSRVTFKITNDSFKGTIPIRRFNIRREDDNSRPFPLDSVGGVTSCQYVLDRVAADGAREGTSICGGLPEETRLEIPRQVHAYLTRKELVVVLLALLSTPPQTSLEPLP